MADDGRISIAGQLPDAADGGGSAKPLDPRILEIARELGRMIAREQFKALIGFHAEHLCDAALSMVASQGSCDER